MLNSKSLRNPQKSPQKSNPFLPQDPQAENKHDSLHPKSQCQSSAKCFSASVQTNPSGKHTPAKLYGKQEQTASCGTPSNLLCRLDLLCTMGIAAILFSRSVHILLCSGDVITEKEFMPQKNNKKAKKKIKTLNKIKTY